MREAGAVLNNCPQHTQDGPILRSSGCKALCAPLPPPTPTHPGGGEGDHLGRVCPPVFSSQPQAPLWDMRASILSASATTAREAPLESWATKPT